MSESSSIIKGPVLTQKYELKKLGVLKDEIEIILPTKEDIKNSDTLYIFIEDKFGNKQFIPIDCRKIKEFVILTNKEEAIKKCSK